MADDKKVLDRNEYPEVRRIKEGHSEHIEPPLDQNWSDLDKLRWNAAVTTLDTGLRVLVHPIGDLYSIQVENVSAGAEPYVEAWRYISAVSTGAMAFKEKNGGT